MMVVAARASFQLRGLDFSPSPPRWAFVAAGCALFLGAVLTAVPVRADIIQASAGGGLGWAFGNTFGQSFTAEVATTIISRSALDRPLSFSINAS